MAVEGLEVGKVVGGDEGHFPALADTREHVKEMVKDIHLQDCLVGLPWRQEEMIAQMLALGHCRCATRHKNEARNDSLGAVIPMAEFANVELI